MATITGTNGNDVIDEAAAGGSSLGNRIYLLDGDDTLIALEKQPYLTSVDNGPPYWTNIYDMLDGGNGIDTLRLTAGSDWSLDLANFTQFFTAAGVSGRGQWDIALTSVEQFDITAFAHGTATLGDGHDRIDVSQTGYETGSYHLGGGDDALIARSGTVTAAMGDGSDRLVLEHGGNNARTNLTGTLSGSLATGYSGTYNRSDGAATHATITFSGVEHFTINTTGSSSAAFDTIVTGDGNDNVSTGAAGDTMTVGRGNDVVDGGSEVDALSIDLSDESMGVRINLLVSGAQQTGGTGSITGIESFHGAVAGSAYNDVLIERAGENGDSRNAQFSTGAGNDVVRVSRGTDSVDMGTGSDRLVLEHSYNTARTNLTGTLSGSLATGYSGTYNRSDGAATYATVAFSGVEHFTINTTGGSNTVAFDTIVTGDGNDIVSTGAGDDVITVARGADVVDGGTGVDVLSIDLSNESADVTIDLLAAGAQQTGGTGSITGVESFHGAVLGSARDDVLIEGIHHYNAQFSTGRGNDVVQVSRGTDTIAMGDGSDRLVLDHSYANARTTMSVALSGDLAAGYSGTYYRSDGAGAYANASFSGVEHFTITTAATGHYTGDSIVTGDGDDVISSGAGDDWVTVAKGTNDVDGGEGTDALGIDFTGSASGVSVDLLLAGAQQVGGSGSVANFESFQGQVTGTRFDDVLREGAHSFNATLETGAGNDLVQVSRGDDIVNMGAGRDRLVLDYSYTNTHLNLGGNQPFAGTFTAGYSGEFYLWGGARTTFSGVEHFTIATAGGIDSVVVGDGNDIVSTGAGDDRVAAGRGVNQVDGGDGTDALSIDFTGRASGVSVDLLLAGAQQSVAPGSVTNFEGFQGQVMGSGFHDVFREGVHAFNATFDTGAGNDLVQVSRGKDIVNMGGGGGDRLVIDYSYVGGHFYGENQPFTGSLAEGYSGEFYLGGGWAQTTFSGVEHFTIRSAGGNDNILVGDGNDVISSGTGSDTIRSGGGNDIIDAGDGDDAIHGGAGADRMTGGAGNDLYEVDMLTDRIIEGADAGVDTVRAVIDYRLGANADSLVMLGSVRRGYGNNLDNAVTGNDAANIIDGGGGADRMVGGAGNDTYYVNQAGDQVVEAAGAGVDTVRSSSHLALAANVERLILIGTGPARGTGNELANVITGNGGANVLNGGAGSDRLSGGGGADRFTFDSALNPRGNVDTILDFSGKDDTIVLDRSIFGGIAANGVLDESAFASGTRARDADDRILYDATGGRLFYDADGVGGAEAVLFARIDPGTILAAADFFAVA